MDGRVQGVLRARMGPGPRDPPSATECGVRPSNSISSTRFHVKHSFPLRYTQDVVKTYGEYAGFATSHLTADGLQLSREEEAAIGEEKEVRKEDQDRINRFSRLHSRQKLLEDELKTKQVCPSCIALYGQD